MSSALIDRFSTDHIDKDFWGFVGLFAYFMAFLAVAAWLLRRSELFKTYARLQRDYRMSPEIKRRCRPRWVGIPLIFIGNSSAKFMLSECQKDGYFFLRPSIFLRAIGLRSVAIPSKKVRGNNRGKRLRLKDGKTIVLRYGNLF